MANWTGAARSNYVRVKNEADFRHAMATYEVKVISDSHGRLGLLADTEDGSWPRCGYDDGADEDFEIDIPALVAEHLVDGEVFVTQQSGSEKLRYVSGYAEAITASGERVTLSLCDIYGLAAAAFGVDVNTISTASY